MTAKQEMTMNNGPQLTKQADELTVDELAQVSGGKPSAPPKEAYLTYQFATATISNYSTWTMRGEKTMRTENLKQQPTKPPADFLNKSNTELTETELRRVSGGLNCCAGVHYNVLGSPEEFQVRK
jgi:bacteriocin-like protein